MDFYSMWSILSFQAKHDLIATSSFGSNNAIAW